MAFGLLLATIGATRRGGYGPPEDSVFWLGLFIFAMGLISCAIAVGKKSEEAMAA